MQEYEELLEKLFKKISLRLWPQRENLFVLLLMYFLEKD